MVSVRNICILQVIVENGNVERTNPPVSSCSSLMHPEGNIPLEINPEFSFTICRNQLSERFLMGDYREKLPFPITENIIGAGFLIGNNRPTPDLRGRPANGRSNCEIRHSGIACDLCTTKYDSAANVENDPALKGTERNGAAFGSQCSFTL